MLVKENAKTGALTNCAPSAQKRKKKSKNEKNSRTQENRAIDFAT
jgi:hypothetical protein